MPPSGGHHPRTGLDGIGGLRRLAQHRDAAETNCFELVAHQGAGIRGHRRIRHHDCAGLPRQQFRRQIGSGAGVQNHVIIDPQQCIDRKREPRRLQQCGVRARASGAHEMNPRQPVLGDDLGKRNFTQHQFREARRGRIDRYSRDRRRRRRQIDHDDLRIAHHQARQRQRRQRDARARGGAENGDLARRVARIAQIIGEPLDFGELSRNVQVGLVEDGIGSRNGDRNGFCIRSGRYHRSGCRRADRCRPARAHAKP